MNTTPPLRTDVDVRGHADDSTPVAETQAALKAWLSDDSHEGAPIHTRLKTSDRVIARVTDGIYREPYAALREVISNAWDADANEVTILTDAPRFSRIYIRDDGMGMTYDTLSRLVHSIGGSAKRTKAGAELRVTSADDRDKSPGGRPLIGKIGIGLFSISQLSRRFKIVTKVAGEPYRLIAEVSLLPYTEEGDEPDEGEETFVNGEVFILRERATDTDSHGTDIILDEIKPGVRDMLRSADRWRAIDEREQARSSGDTDTAAEIDVEKPIFHAGWIPDLSSNPQSAAILARDPELPWASESTPSERMGLLLDAMEGQAANVKRPTLDTTLDKYLQTIWQLALSAPVPYVDRHPYDLTKDDRLATYWMPSSGERPVEVPMEAGETVRDAVKRVIPGNPLLRDGVPTEAGPFRVTVDGVELKRPIRFTFRPTKRGGGVQHSLLFVGSYEPNLAGIPMAQRGGALSLEGYLFWTGRVIPKENNGVLVRIRGAAGAAFDPQFMDYQISEQTRLRQITSEVFVQNGLDAALNIDRESFNFAHPHVQLLHRWLHRGIRYLTNRHKDLTKRILEESRAEAAVATRDELDTWADGVWSRRRGSAEPPDVELTDDEDSAKQARAEGAVAFSRSSISNLAKDAKKTSGSLDDSQVRALLKLLAAYGLFDDRPYEEQRQFIDDVLRIFRQVPAK